MHGKAEWSTWRKGFVEERETECPRWFRPSSHLSSAFPERKTTVTKVRAFSPSSWSLLWTLDPTTQLSWLPFHHHHHHHHFYQPPANEESDKSWMTTTQIVTRFCWDPVATFVNESSFKWVCAPINKEERTMLQILKLWEGSNSIYEVRKRFVYILAFLEWKCFTFQLWQTRVSCEPYYRCDSYC